MSKYIDAEKMIAFLENEKAEHIIGGDYSNGVLDACDNTLAFISSLQQEQPEVDLEKIIGQTYHDGSVADTSDMDHVDYENIAHHFFELGQCNARKA